MNKIKKVVLMLCLILSGAFCFAHSEEGKLGKGDEITIDLIEVSIYIDFVSFIENKGAI